MQIRRKGFLLSPQKHTPRLGGVATRSQMNLLEFSKDQQKIQIQEMEPRLDFSSNCPWVLVVGQFDPFLYYKRKKKNLDLVGCCASSYNKSEWFPLGGSLQHVDLKRINSDSCETNPFHYYDEKNLVNVLFQTEGIASIFRFDVDKKYYLLWRFPADKFTHAWESSDM